MSYQPLTPEQFAAAQKAGYKLEQIIANEKIRKSQSDSSQGFNFTGDANTGFSQSTPQQTDVGTLDELASGVQAVFPNRNLGKILGTPLGYGMTAWTHPENLKYYDTNPHASLGGVAGDLAGDAINVGSLLAAPETFGTSLGARSLFSGTTGAGLSVANSLSQGKSLSDSSVWHDAVGAGTISALLPVLGEPFSALNQSAKDVAIEPRVQSMLRESAPSEVKSYVDAAQNHALKIRDPITGVTNPSPMELAKSHVQKASDIIEGKIRAAGQAVGDAKAASGHLSIGINPETGENYADGILSNFNKSLEDKFGHTVEIPRGDGTSIKINGEKITAGSFANQAKPEPELIQMPDSLKTMSASEKKQILEFHSQLTSLAENPTVARASDITHNLDSVIDWKKLQEVGAKDHFDSFLADIRGQLNHGAIRTSSPELAAANDLFSSLRNTQDEFLGLVGNKLEHAEVPLARVSSGDKSGHLSNVFQQVKELTGVDLQKQAILAKFATDNFGSDTAKTLLQQRINEGAGVAGGYKRAVLSFLKKNTLGHLEPDVTKFALDLARGGSEATPGLVGAIKDFVRPPEYQGLIDQLTTDPKARSLIGTYMNNLSATHSYIGNNLLNAGNNVVQNLFNKGRSLIPNKE